MGWLFSYDRTTLKQAQEEFRQRNFPNDESSTFRVLRIACTAYGKRQWIAIEEKATGDRAVLLILWASNEGCWGYKDMDETMGPVDKDCPISLLELTEKRADGSAIRRHQWATDWRNAVRDRAAEIKNASSELAEGARVMLYGKQYTLKQKTRGGCWTGYGEDGRLYRFRRAQAVQMQPAQ